MKTTFRFSFLFIVLITGIFCKNAPSTHAGAESSTATTVAWATETPKTDATNASGGYLTCKVDGVPLQAAYPSVMILYVPAKKEVNIWGKTPKGIISIIIDEVESTGTFTIKGNSKNAAGLLNDTQMYEVKKKGTPFTVTIESIDELKAINAPKAKAIRGTFQGKLMDQGGNMIDITEGKFSTQ